jgi:poly-gamma-glutamate biosynthesis protein PgsC/CapC
MSALVTEAIGVGLVAALLFGELFGLTAGGMVVPGYLAMELSEPLRVLATFAVALVVLYVVRGADKVTLLYGRRRFAVTLLLGFVVGMIVNYTLGFDMSAGPEAHHAIGFVIPGLLAHSMESQGIVVTSSAVVIVSVMVHLGLMAAFGGSIQL